jgi:hypothetical protein
LISISLKYEVSDWLEDLGLIYLLLLELRSLAIISSSEGLSFLFLTSVGEETSFRAVHLGCHGNGSDRNDRSGGKLAGRAFEVAGDDCREFGGIVEVPLSLPVHPKSLG